MPEACLKLLGTGFNELGVLLGRSLVVEVDLADAALVDIVSTTVLALILLCLR